MGAEKASPGGACEQSLDEWEVLTAGESDHVRREKGRQDVQAKELGGCCCRPLRVVSDTLRPHGLQHTRFPCPLLSPRVCLNSIELMIQTSHPLSSPSLPSCNLSQDQGLFQ